MRWVSSSFVSFSLTKLISCVEVLPVVLDGRREEDKLGVSASLGCLVLGIGDWGLDRFGNKQHVSFDVVLFFPRGVFLGFDAIWMNGLDGEHQHTQKSKKKTKNQKKKERKNT